MGIQINGQTDTITATDGSFTLSGSVGIPSTTDINSGNINVTGVSTFNSVEITGILYDTHTNVGAGDSVLISTGIGVSWIDVATAALQGVQGVQGVQGTQGLQGIQGIQGTQGVQGIQGVQGTFGTQGTQGIQGVQGVQGTQGLQGTQGVQGTFGTQGIQGVQGTQSLQGVQGTQGTFGTQGIQGVQGSSAIVKASGFTDNDGGSAGSDAVIAEFTGLNFSGYQGNLLQVFGRTAINEDSNTSNTAILYVQIIQGANTTLISASRNGNPHGGFTGNFLYDISTSSVYTIPSTYATTNVTLRLRASLDTTNTFWYGDQPGYNNFDTIADSRSAGVQFYYVVFGT